MNKINNINNERIKIKNLQETQRLAPEQKSHFRLINKAEAAILNDHNKR